jgi:hypothetical protein
MASEDLWFASCLETKHTKEAVKLNDFNPLPRFETSPIRVSWRKPGLHRASPSLRDFPFPIASLRKRPEQGRFFIFHGFNPHHLGDKLSLQSI